MSEPSLPGPKQQVLFTELEDGTAVLLDLDTKFYYTLNPTGTLVWKALSEQPAPSLGALARRISTAFRVDPATAERDILALLDELRADGLILDPKARP